MKIEIIREDIPGRSLWRVRWGYKEALRTHFLSALVRAWWRNRKYIASCANAGAVPRRGSDVGTSPLLGQKSGEA